MGEFFLFLLGISILVLIIWFGMKILGSIFKGGIDLFERASEFGFIGQVLFFGAWFFMLPLMLIWSFFAGLDDNYQGVGGRDSIDQKDLGESDRSSKVLVSPKRKMDTGILESLSLLQYENGRSMFTLDDGEEGFLPTDQWQIYRPSVLPHPLNQLPAKFYFFYHQNALFADNFLQITHHGVWSEFMPESVEILRSQVHSMIRHHAIGSGPISDLVVEYPQSTINDDFKNVVFTTYKKGSHFHQGFDVQIGDQKYSFSIECADSEFEGLFRTALNAAMKTFRLGIKIN